MDPTTLAPAIEPHTEVSIESTAAPIPRVSGTTHARFGDPKPIGQGGLGVVTALRDRLLGRTVAQKRLRGDGAPDPHRADQLWREARITAELEHPGVIPVYDAGTDADGAPWYAMRHVQGQTLAEAIVLAPGLHDRLRLLGRLLAASETLAFAHARGVVHCDVKPSNILLGPFGETLVIDWGMARVNAGSSAPRSGAPPRANGARIGGGTPAYMSPERLVGSAPDASADCWSLGATLYELLTGRGPPRWDPSPPGWTARLLANADQPDLPRDLLAIALRALAADPSDRYPDAGAFAHDLRTWTEGRFVGAHDYSLREALRLLAKRHRTPLTFSVLTLVSVAIAALIGWSNTHEAAARATAAAARADAANTLSVERLARLALARAETAFAEERWGEAEVLAAAALEWADDPRARGVLWRTQTRRRPRLSREVILPRRCERAVVRDDGAALLCEEVDGISAWDLDPPVQRWRREGARQAMFVGERVVMEDSRLVWTLMDAQGAAGQTVLRGDAAPIPGTLHAEVDGGALVWATGYELFRESFSPASTTRRRLCVDAPVTALASRPDRGVLLYTCGQLGPLIDATGRAHPLGGAEPNFLRLDPTGARVLLGRRDHTLEIRDESGDLLRTVTSSLRDARGARWTGDGTLAASFGDDPGIWLVEPATGRSLGRLPAASGRLAGTSTNAVITSVATSTTTRLGWWVADSEGTRVPGEVGLADACLSPDATRVARARSDGDLRVSRLDGGAGWSARWQPRVIKSCAWSPDGRLLAAVGMDDPAVHLFDGATGAAWARLETPAPVRTLAFAHHGAHLVVSTYGRGYLIFDVETGERLHEDRADHEIGVLDTLEDGSALVGLSYAGTVWVHSAETTTLTPLVQHAGASGLAIGGAGIAVGLPEKRQILLLDQQTGATRALVETGAPVSGDLTMSPDGRWLAAGGVDGWMRVWDLPARRLHATVRAGEARVPVVRFGGAGQWLLTAGWDGDMVLYPMEPLGWSGARWRAEAERRWGLEVDELLDASE